MSKTYTHLTYALRCQIYGLKQSGKSQVAIAQQLGVSQSRISRELSRNRGMRGYRYKQAHRLATFRRHHASNVRRVLTAKRLEQVAYLLRHEQWSPEQIAADIRASEGIKLCHERFIGMSGRTKSAVARCINICASGARNVTNAPARRRVEG